MRGNGWKWKLNGRKWKRNEFKWKMRRNGWKRNRNERKLMDENEKWYKVVARDAPIVSVSAIFQGIGTLEFPPILANTDIFIFWYENTDKKYLRPNMEINGYFVICTVFFIYSFFLSFV